MYTVSQGIEDGMKRNHGDPLRVGVLVSGGGTNLQAIIDKIKEGGVDYEVVVVISNKADAFGLERARGAGISGVFLNRNTFENDNDYNHALLVLLNNHGVDLVVMAGYMRLLGEEVLDAFPNKVVNLHPSLLPKYPGEHGIDDTYDSGDEVGGITVHFANEVYDEGPIITQVEVPVVVNGERLSRDEFEERIHASEHATLPEVVQWIAEGRVSVSDDLVVTVA